MGVLKSTLDDDGNVIRQQNQNFNNTSTKGADEDLVCPCL